MTSPRQASGASDLSTNIATALTKLPSSTLNSKLLPTDEEVSRLKACRYYSKLLQASRYVLTNISYDQFPYFKNLLLIVRSFTNTYPKKPRDLYNSLVIIYSHFYCSLGYFITAIYFTLKWRNIQRIGYRFSYKEGLRSPN
jgi:hypothetical protein